MSGLPVSVVVGLGQMGGTFAHGLLRAGHTVVPVTRGADVAAIAREVPEPALVLVAVGEDELSAVLRALPEPWRDRVALLQNELLPVDWERARIAAPTVAVVWFEKKRDTGVRPILPTPIAGPRAELLRRALDALQIPAICIEQDALLFELVRKDLYILTANLAGLEVGGTVGALWDEHRGLAQRVATEVLAIEAWRAGQTLPGTALVEGMVEAFRADPGHATRGRSAPARLRRALSRATDAGLHVPTLRSLERHLAP